MPGWFGIIILWWQKAKNYCQSCDEIAPWCIKLLPIVSAYKYSTYFKLGNWSDIFVTFGTHLLHKKYLRLFDHMPTWVISLSLNKVQCLTRKMNFIYQVLANCYISSTHRHSSESVLHHENLKPFELSTIGVKKASLRGYTQWKTKNRDFISARHAFKKQTSGTNVTS